MRKSFTVIALLTASLISVFGQGNTSQNAPNAADESAVRALVQKCIEGWNKGSGEAFAAQFAEDSDFVVGNGMHVQGPSAERLLSPANLRHLLQGDAALASS